MYIIFICIIVLIALLTIKIENSFAILGVSSIGAFFLDNLSNLINKKYLIFISDPGQYTSILFFLPVNSSLKVSLIIQLFRSFEV
jgi:hypothetical protein